MSTIRCLLSYNRVVCARPGYSALSPPAYTSDYLALDSNWNFSQLERPIQAGLLIGISAGSRATISYGTSISPVPMVQIFEFLAGSPPIIKHEPQIHTVQGGNNQWTTPFSLACFNTNFTFDPLPAGGFATPWTGVARNWMYIVWGG